MEVAVTGVAKSEMKPAQITPPFTAHVTETRDPVEEICHFELKSCLLDITDEGLVLTLPTDVDTDPATSKFLFIGYEIPFELESRYA